MQMQKNNQKWKVHSYQGQLQEAEKIPDKQSNFTLKGARRRPNKMQSKQREGSNTRVDINKTYQKNQRKKKSMKLRADSLKG